MVNVKCISAYYDTKLNKRVVIGEEFEVTENRAKQLINAKVVEVTTPTAEKVVKQTRKKKGA